MCVTPNKLPRSVYLLKQLFRKFKGTDYNNRKFCANCNVKADNCSCEMPMFGYLLAIPIEKPLEAIVKSTVNDKSFEGENFRGLLGSSGMRE